VRAAALLACCACGHVDFDARPTGDGGAAPDAPDIGYFLSPAGNDANPGTRAAPWLTFDHAFEQMQPGDRLNLLDGDYDGKGPTGPLHIDCTAGAVNGTAAAPIVVRADHPRRAHLYNTTSPLHVSQCAYWEIDDLWLEGVDDAADPAGAVAWVNNNSSNIVLHGLLVLRPNRHNNNNALEIGHSANVTVEDSEAYDYILAAFMMYASTNTTFRRLYANGRGAVDIDYPSVCAGGDRGVASYYNSGGTIEDAVVENVCDAGMEIETGYHDTGDTGLGDNHAVRSSIAIGTGNAGFAVYSDCETANPCSGPDGVASGNTITSSVAIGFNFGFSTMGIGTELTNTSAFGSSIAGIDLTVLSTTGGYNPTAYVQSALVVNAPTGIQSANQMDWSVMGSTVFGATTAYSPNDTHVTGSTAIDPMLGGCEVYIPPGALQGVGADIRTLASTGDPYWLADGTFAACGVVVPGVNDDPATSCIGVHTRLNVGTNGCALP
jgi:hypothetical protein